MTLECAGNGRARTSPRPISQPWLDEAVGTAEWTGVPLAPLLEEAGVRDGAVDVVFTGADHGVERGVEQDYQRGISLAEAQSDRLFLAHTMNGQPLPPQHGAPLRLLVPGWYGMAHVKWLVRITVVDRPFDGFQNATAYRITHDADDPGEPVDRIQPRALVRPAGVPGVPDPHPRGGRRQPRAPRPRLVRAGAGRPGRGQRRRRRDLGATPSWARPGASTSGGAGRGPGGPRPRDASSCCARATDAAGNVQPVEQRWNRQAMANNHVQRVPVVVR